MTSDEEKPLMGYLVHKPGGPFGRLKSSKRQYYYFDKGQCRLYYYVSEEECRHKWTTPLGSIFIGESAIALSNDDAHQFIIHSEGKEHILRAHSHRNMMMWALALQAERDSWEKKALESPNGKEAQQRLNVKNAPQAGPLEDWSFSSKPSLELNSKAILRRMSIAKVTISSSPPKARERRRNSTMPEIGFLRSSDPPRRKVEEGSVDGVSNSSRSSSQPSLIPTTSPSKSISKPLTCLEEQVEDSGLPSATNNADVSPKMEELGSNIDPLDRNGKCDNDSSPETESASENDRLGIDDDDEIQDDDTIDMLMPRKKSEVPILRLSAESSCQDSDNPADCSNSKVRPLSLDETPLQDSPSSVQQLQNELISVKCELARSLNRENSNKTALDVKDSAILSLKEKLDKLENLHQRTKKRELEEMAEEKSTLNSQINFLNREVFKLSRLLQQEQFRNHSKQLNIQNIQGDIDQLKRDYVFLLQSCIRLTCTDGSEMMELYMYGEKRHKQRVFALLEEARKTNSSLPNIEAITTSLCHVDSLGFKHMFVDKSLILHYVCRQLHHHYSAQLRSHAKHLAHWKLYLKKHLTDGQLVSTPELKALVRRGVPEEMRGKVWSALYRSKVRDLREKKGANYFVHLCSMATESESLQHLDGHKRQISLDLLRTMPNNINFCDRNAEGIKSMQDILNAFCLHNSKLGYCQGMNFLVGMTLLFMDAEDAFWCLIAIVERYFTLNYFDQNLIGAQADQEVLKDLLKSKLPKISAHLAELDIELCTITLNWFLSIFIDSVPLETLLRIWDCFLLEGPKVLFRFSLAILRLQEEAILAKHDTVSIMRQLKAAAKLCFDVDGLISAAFEDLEPFPSRQEIAAKQSAYYKILEEKTKKKERELQAMRERERMMAQVELEGTHNHLIECAAVWGRDKVWVCHGHHHGSRVSMVNCQDNIMYRLHIEFESRVMCMHVPNDDAMLFGTFSHFVHAYHTVSRKKMWEICLNASVLSLCSHQRDGVKQVFAGLADGTLAVVENVQGRMPKPEVFYVVIGSSPVTCLHLVGRRLWCACGSNIIILSARTLDLLDQFQTSSNGLDYIYRMICGEQGVWITLRGSSILQLWDPHILTCRLLYDVRDNFCSRAVDEAYTNHARITSVLPFDSSVLVGTADGTLIIYDVVAKKSPGASLPSSPRPMPPQSEPGQTNAKQIQERLQKLFIEQQMMEIDSDGTRRSVTSSPNLTPASNVSRRESSSEASSTNQDLTNEMQPAVQVQEAPPTAPVVQRVGSPKKMEEMKDVQEEEEAVELNQVDRDTRNLLTDSVQQIDRSSRYYTKGFRKSSFTISTPIAEEENGIIHETEETSKAGESKPTELEVDDSENLPDVPDEQQERKFHDSPQKHEPVSEAPETFNRRFNQVTAGDLLTTDITLMPDSDMKEKLTSYMDLSSTNYPLKESKQKYQSLSAEDIPTWVAQERPQPVISKKGDVTFTYKSRLPSIKAFIKKEAFELGKFLKASGALDKLGEEIDESLETSKDSEGQETQRRRAFSGPFFSIRPPTLDLADSQVWPSGNTDTFLLPDQLPTPTSIEITVEGGNNKGATETQVFDSRRSSASVQSLTQDDVIPFLANDDDFLSTVQLNDLLQLQDWTRTSRKGSDTASNVSFGSNEVPFAFELVLKEKIKISDKPIRTLLHASCNGEPIIISCAGFYGDDEAVLKWTTEGEEKLWTNDPVIEVCPYTHTIKPSPYARSRLPRRASIATSALSGSVDFDGTFSRATRAASPAASAGILVESGIAKVQHLLSRVSDRT